MNNIYIDGAIPVNYSTPVGRINEMKSTVHNGKSYVYLGISEEKCKFGQRVSAGLHALKNIISHFYPNVFLKSGKKAWDLPQGTVDDWKLFWNGRRSVVLYTSNPFLAVKISADRGDAASQYNLGLFYENQGSNEDAAYYYRAAAKQGHAKAQVNLGSLYLEGKGVVQSYEKALKYFNAQIDDPVAQFNLAEMYDQGLGVEQSDREAMKYYVRAAKAGNIPAQLMVGLKFIKKQKYKDAFNYYKLAANQGNSQAQSNIGYMYEMGMGVDQSDEKAKEYYALAKQNQS